MVLKSKNKGEKLKVNNYDGYISSPRPLFEDPPDPKKGVQRLKLGSTSAGVIIDVSEKGITINGYYQSFSNEDTFFSCVREPAEMTWEELEKVKRVAKPSKKKKVNKKKKDILEPDKIDEPSEEYLDSLPIVTINKKKYYLDTELRHRRPTDNPNTVFKY